MKDRIRKNLDVFLFQYCVPTRIQKLLPRTAILYIFFGVISTSVDLIVFYLCSTWLGIGYILAATVSFVFSSTTNFITNKYLNYQNASRKLALQYGVHFSIGLTTLLLTYLFLYFFIGILGLAPLVAKVMSAFILAFYSYFAHTYITFNHNRFSA